jgi:hypothetical protein
MRWTLIFLIALLALGCGKRGPRAGQTSEGPDSFTTGRPWKPDAKLLDQLDPPTEVAGYLVRPPKGYKRTDTRPKSAPITIANWEAPHKDGGDRVCLDVSVWEITEEQRPKAQPETVLKGALDARAKIADPFSRLPIEHGTLGGLAFVRSGWSGQILFQKQKTMKGYHYIALDGNRLIQLSAQAEAADRPDLLDLVEAGLLTFQKK